MSADKLNIVQREITLFLLRAEYM